jgi:N-acetylmuramoyl-L-alanine amidase
MQKRKGGVAMPYLFLSPSTQEGNLYVNGGSEEYWMNRLTDEIEPYLRASGVNVTRNDPTGTAVTAIRQSNRGNYDFHLALHSNAAPEGSYGSQRGSIVFYYPGSVEGLRMASILVDNLRPIYPLPDRVRAEPSTSIGELRQTRAPSAFLELAYHDNPDDAAWIQNNLSAIAQAIALSVTEYFGLPFLRPGSERAGVVTLTSGSLNLRNAPSTDASVLLRIPNGAAVTIVNEYDSWYVVDYRGTLGFARSEYIS